MQWSHEHLELKRTTQRIVEEHINPYVGEWEEAGRFLARSAFRQLCVRQPWRSTGLMNCGGNG
jgi:citronellyl-CoA dehydrogenase